MRENHIPTAPFIASTSYKQRFPGREPVIPGVIKASGLAEGKGVVAAGTFEQAREAVRDSWSPGDSVPRRHGRHRGLPPWQAISVHAFCDDRTAVLFPAHRITSNLRRRQRPEHRRDGRHSSMSWVTRGHLDTIHTRIVQPVLDGLRREQAGFVRLLVSKSHDRWRHREGRGVQRPNFGDPEAQTYYAPP